MRRGTARSLPALVSGLLGKSSNRGGRCTVDPRSTFIALPGHGQQVGRPRSAGRAAGGAAAPLRTPLDPGKDATGAGDIAPNGAEYSLGAGRAAHPRAASRETVRGQPLQLVLHTKRVPPAPGVSSGSAILRYESGVTYSVNRLDVSAPSRRRWVVCANDRRRSPTPPRLRLVLHRSRRRRRGTAPLAASRVPGFRCRTSTSTAHPLRARSRCCPSASTTSSPSSRCSSWAEPLPASPPERWHLGDLGTARQPSSSEYSSCRCSRPPKPPS